MATIFISHSSQDDKFVDQLFSDLILIGHKPWTDDKRIRPGDPLSRLFKLGCRSLVTALSSCHKRRWGRIGSTLSGRRSSGIR